MWCVNSTNNTTTSEKTMCLEFNTTQSSGQLTDVRNTVDYVRKAGLGNYLKGSSGVVVVLD